MLHMKFAQKLLTLIILYHIVGMCQILLFTIYFEMTDFLYKVLSTCL